MGGIGFNYWNQPTTSWEDEIRTTDVEADSHDHGDFLVYLGTKKLDFTDDRYQSTASSTKSADVHLHDNKGDVIHLHADGVSLAYFFTSIGFTLTSECFTLDTGEANCIDEANVLELYVNGELYDDAPEYIINDEDRILLYYGTADQPALQQYLDEITDLSCMYSGTCPERGTPPPEECGLTCEL